MGDVRVNEPWEPLEGTPEAFNVLATRLGLDTQHWCFVHVLGLDKGTLASTPAGAVALILLYPTTEEAEHFLRRPIATTTNLPNGVFFVRQLVGGTCGIIAVLHALVNNAAVLGDAVEKDSVLWEFQRKSSGGGLDEESAVESLSLQLLESEAVHSAHQSAAACHRHSCVGQRQGRHFITFVNMDGRLVELDGRRGAPACRDETSPLRFLNDAATEVSALVNTIKDPIKQLQFSLVALVPVNQVKAN